MKIRLFLLLLTALHSTEEGYSALIDGGLGKVAALGVQAGAPVNLFNNVKQTSNSGPGNSAGGAKNDIGLTQIRKFLKFCVIYFIESNHDKLRTHVSFKISSTGNVRLLSPAPNHMQFMTEV